MKLNNFISVLFQTSTPPERNQKRFTDCPVHPNPIAVLGLFQIIKSNQTMFTCNEHVTNVHACSERGQMIRCNNVTEIKHKKRPWTNYTVQKSLE